MNVCAQRGPCTNERPWTVLLGGPDLIDEADNGLVFSAENPCGAELGTALAQTPLVVLDAWANMLGDVPQSRCTSPASDRSAGWCSPNDDGDCWWCRRPCSKPGARALISGHVLAHATTQGPGVVSSEKIPPCGANVMSSQPRVKLRVTSCGSPGPVIIDSDSVLVVPAGYTEIEVIGPASWQIMGRVELEDETLWMDTTLRITGCPISCCYCPAGELTEWLTFADTTELADRVLVRPRRARRLAMHGATLAGVLATVGVQAMLDPGGVFIIGASAFTAGTPTLEVIGAAPFWAPVSPAGTIRATLRWGIV